MRALFWCGVTATFFAACSSTRNEDVCCTSAADCKLLGVSDPLACNGDLVCRANECVEPDCRVDADCNSVSQSICDLAMHECRGCNSDDECASEVCDFDSGRCVDESTVRYASPTGSDTADCARLRPCTLTRALATLESGSGTIKATAGHYVSPLHQSGGEVSLHAFGVTIATSEPHAIEIDQSGALRVYGGVFSSSYPQSSGSGSGLHCISEPQFAPARAIARDATFGGAFAVSANHCNVTLSRVTLAGDYLALVADSRSTATIDRAIFTSPEGVVAGGYTSITNSVFVGARTDLGAVGGSATVSFSTFIDSTVRGGGGSGSISCTPPTTGTCIDNSVFLNSRADAPIDTISGNGPHVSYSIVYPQSSGLVGDHNMLGVDPTLVDPAGGDYHLQAGSPAIDAADPAAADATDFDGNARPRGAGRDIGAFERVAP